MFILCSGWKTAPSRRLLWSPCTVSHECNAPHFNTDKAVCILIAFFSLPVCFTGHTRVSLWKAYVDKASTWQISAWNSSPPSNKHVKCKSVFWFLQRYSPAMRLHTLPYLLGKEWMQEERNLKTVINFPHNRHLGLWVTFFFWGFM